MTKNFPLRFASPRFRKGEVKEEHGKWKEQFCEGNVKTNGEGSADVNDVGSEESRNNESKNKWRNASKKDGTKQEKLTEEEICVREHLQWILKTASKIIKGETSGSGDVEWSKLDLQYFNAVDRILR